MEQGLSEKVRELRRFVRLAGKATPIEQLVLDLADRNAHLEFTLELEEAWDESEHTFFADFLVVKIEQLQKKIIELEEG